MKVLLLPSWYPSENKPLNGIFFKEQAEALRAKGVNVIVLSINIKDIRGIFKEKIKNKLNVSIENGVVVYRYTTYNYFPKIQEAYLRYYAKLIDILIKKIIQEQGDIDLVHIHSALDAGIAYSLSKINIPYIITEHSSRYSRKLLSKSEKKYLNNVFSGAKKVLSVGIGLKKDISAYFDYEKISIIPNMVKLPDINENIKKTNIYDNKIKFFSLGFLTYKKGMDLIIEAYNLGKNELKDVQIIIGGSGEEFNKLNEQIKFYGLEENIILLGELNREEVSINMMNCDAFILTSRNETFGIVFIEAMYYGKPVIATITGGPDSFVNDECGILVENENIEEIKNAMIKMKKSYKNYNSDYIIKFCRENFSEDVVAKRLIEIYREVIS